MPNIAIETRLKNFNLSSTTIQLANLEVQANQTLVLDTKDPKYSKNLSFLEPKSIDDIKRWIGIPDQAFATVPVTSSRSPVVIHRTISPDSSIRSGIVIPSTARFHPDQVATLQIMARNYIFGHSSTVSVEQVPALNEWLKAQQIKIPIFVFNDIHVAAGAVLNVKSKVLFANHITIDKGGLIKMGNQSSIHAAGVKGL